jgi:hypothetical protein
MGYLLFLDDIRVPLDCCTYMMNRDFYQNNEFVIVRDYNEFTNYIETNGLPDIISFDHDLADSHYTPEYLWDDYEKSKAWQDAQVHTEKTGYDCAKWLIDYCIENNLNCPEYTCHSMNPVGKDNIMGVLDNFKKYQDNALS